MAYHEISNMDAWQVIRLKSFDFIVEFLLGSSYHTRFFPEIACFCDIKANMVRAVFGAGQTASSRR